MFKYILTLGPSSDSENIISRLLHTADAFRLNSSHLTVSELKKWLIKLDKIFSLNNKTVPVVIDLQGSKMRIANYPDSLSVHESLHFINYSSSENTQDIPVPHKDFFESVKVGDIVTLNDAKIKVKITETDFLSAFGTVLQNGPLSSHKGINIENHPVVLTELSPKDKNIINEALTFEFTQFAYSFLLNGSEAEFLRPYTKERKIIAKIERAESFDFLKNIAKNFDEIWLCRGDLGAQAGIQKLGQLQDIFKNKIPEIKKDCILAGQVLEYMTHFPNPTRSEVVHLYDVKKSGFKGIVLSDETAIGKNPVSVADFIDTDK